MRGHLVILELSLDFMSDQLVDITGELVLDKIFHIAGYSTAPGKSRWRTCRSSMLSCLSPLGVVEVGATCGGTVSYMLFLLVHWDLEVFVDGIDYGMTHDLSDDITGFGCESLDC